MVRNQGKKSPVTLPQLTPEEHKPGYVNDDSAKQLQRYPQEDVQGTLWGFAASHSQPEARKHPEDPS